LKQGKKLLLSNVHEQDVLATIKLQIRIYIAILLTRSSKLFNARILKKAVPSSAQEAIASIPLSRKVMAEATGFPLIIRFRSTGHSDRLGRNGAGPAQSDPSEGVSTADEQRGMQEDI